MKIFHNYHRDKITDEAIIYEIYANNATAGRTFRDCFQDLKMKIST